MNLYYKNSNKINIPRFGLGFLVATLMSLLLTAAAALLGLWLGRPYVGIFLVALLALASAFIYYYMLKITKTRNKPLAHLSILLSSIFAAYYHMMVVTSAVSTIGPYLENSDPSAYIDHLPQILFTNIFVTSSSFEKSSLFLNPAHVFGSFLTSGIPWIVYFVIIIASLIILPQLSVAITTNPFSEQYNQWMNKVYSIGRLQHFLPDEKEMLKSQLEQGVIDLLLQRNRITRYNAMKYAKLFFYKVDNLHSGYVGIENFYHKRTAEGELSVDSYLTELFIPPILLGEENAKKLEALLNSSALMSFGLEDSIPNATFNKISSTSKSNQNINRPR